MVDRIEFVNSWVFQSYFNLSNAIQFKWKMEHMYIRKTVVNNIHFNFCCRLIQFLLC